MSVYDFEGMREHIGHKIECVRYGQGDECLNVAVECVTCGAVLFDLHNNEHFEKMVDVDEKGITQESWEMMSKFQKSMALEKLGASDDACFECAKMEYSDLPYEWKI